MDSWSTVKSRRDTLKAQKSDAAGVERKSGFFCILLDIHNLAGGPDRDRTDDLFHAMM
jgi:hypothetical protein